MQGAYKRSFGLVFLIPMLLSASGPQATIEDTGSTNRPGLRVTLDRDGNATVQQRSGEVQHVKLRERLCNRFIRDLKDMGPLSTIPARHCIKSVSFGSSLFVEYDGQKSPDLSCPGPAEPRIDGLQKNAQQILEAAREAAGMRPRNVFRMRAAYPPKS